VATLRTAATRAAAAVAFVLVIGYPWTQRTPEPTPPPPGTVSTTTTLRIPGTPPRLPWPRSGQAAVEVAGIGPLGSAGTAAPVPVASIAKVMTALVVLTDHPLDAGHDGPGITVTTAEAAAYTREAHDGESHIPVRAGEVLTQRQALEAMLLPSANNIARILARWDAGSVRAFVARMNLAAAVLGMAATFYTDPAGFDPASVSTAADQLILAEHAMAVPALAQIVAMRAATVPLAGRVRNVNRLLGTAGIVGIKTGSMTRSGGCLLFAARARVPGTTATVTILGAVLGQDGLSYAGLAPTFRASQALVTATAQAVRPRTVLPAGATVGHLDGADLVTAAPVTVLGWPGLALTAHLSATAAPATPDRATVGQLDVTGAGTRARVAVLLRR
jgi:D-alanyl-D-alanine carboxypeptidase (penicillin-binding protein 5/6)